MTFSKTSGLLEHFCVTSLDFWAKVEDFLLGANRLSGVVSFEGLDVVLLQNNTLTHVKSTSVQVLTEQSESAENSVTRDLTRFEEKWRCLRDE